MSASVGVCLSGVPEGADEDEGEGGSRQAREGTPLNRDSYFAQRRVNPYDGKFNTAGARLVAYDQMAQDQARLAAALPSSMIHLETWKSIGPAPILGQIPAQAAQLAEGRGRRAARQAPPACAGPSARCRRPHG